MKTLKAITMYEIDGKTFTSINNARDHCENKMEKEIRDLFNEADISQYIHGRGMIRLMELLCNDTRRKRFIEHLSYDLNMKDDEDYYD